MSYAVAAVVLSFIITGYLASRPARLSVLYGILIAPAFGIWFVAPELLRQHYLWPEHGTQWAIVFAYLLASFAVIGLLVSAATGWLFGIVLAVRKEKVERPTLAALSWTMLTFPVGYALTGFAPYWALHPGVPSADRLSKVGVMLAVAIPAAALCVVLLRRLDRARGLAFMHVSGLTAALFLLGAASLPLRLNPKPSVPSLPHLSASATETPRSPLLVLGIDGATWRVIQPVIDRGAAPTLARLSAAGVRGTIKAEWPPYYWSAPAWGAILTGHNRDVTGIHEDLSLQAANLPLFQLPLGFEPLLNAPLFLEAVLIYYDVMEPMPTPRPHLGVKPIWERLAQRGDRVGVVGMPFTYPASGPAHWVVSDRVGIDLWRLMSVAPGDRHRAIHPLDDRDSLMTSFADNEPLHSRIFSTLFPQQQWPMPRDAFMHPLEVLRQVVRDTEGMFGASEWILRKDPAVNMLMVYVGSFDNVAHGFWQYRFPEDFPEAPPDRRDVEALGPVVDRYVEYLDQHVARLIAAFPHEPNVVIVSDHGEGRTADRFGWKGVHARDGLFLAAGPAVAADPGLVDVSYYDVAPTVLALRGVSHPDDLSGRVLVSEPRR